MNAPPTAAALLQQGLFHHQRGELSLAMDRYTDVLRINPNDADALYYVAVVACQEGQYKEGAELARRAIENGPPQARVHNLLGQAHDRLGEPLEAIKQYDKAIAINPNLAEAHGNRASILADADFPDEALKSYDRALALHPNATDWLNRGTLLHGLLRFDEAIESFDKALAFTPDDPAILMNRAGSLAMLERYEEAEEIYSAIIKRDPAFQPAYAHKALAIKQAGRLAESGTLLEQALSMDANDHATAYALSRLMLQTGDWAGAWSYFERRASMREPAYVPLKHPRWNGEAPGDFRLVLLGEQGLGDTVHFGRYASLLAAQGHAVTLIVPPVLAPLMRTLPGVESVVTSTEELERDPRRILWLPLMSVMAALHIEPDSIPQQGKYLSAEPARVAKFAERLAGRDGLKVGLMWNGVSNAVPLPVLAPLSDIPGVRLISLQKGPAAGEMDSVSFGARIERILEATDMSSEALLDSAAAMANLDLIVSIDSMPAHLAGALGRPVLLALRHVPDWRWFTERADSPFYPTFQLFRQDADRQWGPVFERIAGALRERVAAVRG